MEGHSEVIPFDTLPIALLGGTTRLGSMSMTPVIWKWSVQAGWSSGLVLHSIKACSRAELQKTLSGLDMLPILKVLMVGIPAGSSISIRKVLMRSTRREAVSRLAVVNSQVLFELSHRGWCLLKSPSQTTWFVSFWWGGASTFRKPVG